MINGGLKLNEENEFTVNPLECDVATATPVANEPKAFLRAVLSKCAVIDKKIDEDQLNLSLIHI